MTGRCSRDQCHGDGHQSFSSWTTQALRARTAGRSAGVGRRRALAGQRDHGDRIAGHVEKLDRAALLGDTRYRMPFHDRSDVASTQPTLGDVAGQDHVSVYVEGHGLPRVHGSESGYVGASVNLPYRAEADVPAAGRL